MSAREKTEALTVGQRSVTPDGLDAVWRAVNARHATFKDELLKPGEPDPGSSLARRVALFIRDVYGRAVSRFTLNLAAMR